MPSVEGLDGSTVQRSIVCRGTGRHRVVHDDRKGKVNCIDRPTDRPIRTDTPVPRAVGNRDYRLKILPHSEVHDTKVRYVSGTIRFKLDNSRKV